MTATLALHHFLGACREIARAELGPEYAVERLRAVLAEYDAKLAPNAPAPHFGALTTEEIEAGSAERTMEAGL